jgi:23S rRNA pseudouridine1911/1915/1917 synthase
MLQVLFEDECLLAIDKPAGVVVHPTYRNQSGTLLDALRVREPDATLSIVGRLDKLTSGIVVVAKSALAHAALQRGWPDAEKDYLAFVHGCVEPASGRIDLPLGADPSDRRRRIVRPDGAPSVTRFDRIAYEVSSNRSLLRCRLLTGRRHQIRVHLAARGWPIVGDAVYGAAWPGLPRHALHAWRLALAHPATGAPLHVEAPLPRDVVWLQAKLEHEGLLEMRQGSGAAFQAHSDVIIEGKQQPR